MVSIHCSSDAIELLMPALAPHDDIGKRHTIVGMVTGLRSKKRDSEKETEDKGACCAALLCPLSSRLPVLPTP